MLGCRNSANLKRSSSFGHNVNYYNQTPSAIGNHGLNASNSSTNNGGNGFRNYMMDSPQPQPGNLTKSTMNLSYQSNQQHQNEYSATNITSQLSQSQQMLLSKGLYGPGVEEAAKNLGNVEVTPEMTEKLLLKLLLQQISAQKQQSNGLPSGLQASQILQQLQSHHQQQQQQSAQKSATASLNSQSNNSSNSNTTKINGGPNGNGASPILSSKWNHGQPHMNQVQQAKQMFSNSNYNNLLTASNADPSTSPLPAQATTLSTSSSSSSTVNQNNNSNTKPNNTCNRPKNSFPAAHKNFIFRFLSCIPFT